MHPHKCPDFDHGEVKPGDPMMEFCQCEPITMEQRIAAMNTCAVHCPMCEGQDHHWMPDCDEDNGQPVMCCKHCEARRPYTDEDE